MSFYDKVRDYKRTLIEQALKSAPTVSAAARELRVCRQYLYEISESLGVEIPKRERGEVVRTRRHGPSSRRFSA